MQEKNNKMSYEEFLAWCDEDTLAEWVDGEVIKYSPASFRHQKIVNFLSRLLGMYIEMNNLGEILIAPFQMKLERSGREPDILFVKKERLNILNTTYIDGPADLVIEIIAEESRMRDKKIKFEEYEEAGIKEYWLIDPYDKVANFYVLKRNKYQKIEPKQDIYYSEVIKGFWLNINWLFEEPLPKVVDILREFGMCVEFRI
jgi:Uma2 family endonuclease